MAVPTPLPTLRWHASVLARGFVATLALAFAGCAQFRPVVAGPDFLVPAHTTFTADRVALPTSSALGLLFIEAKINGAGPFRLLVDSAASGLLLSQRTAGRAGVKPEPGSLPGAGVTATVPIKIARVETVESGGLKLSGLWAGVADDAHLAGAEDLLGFHLDGLIAGDTLSEVVLELDFPRRQVSAIKPGTETFPMEKSASWEKNGSMVTLDLQGKPMPVQFDTGSSGGFDLPALDTLPLLFGKDKKAGVAGASLGQKADTRKESGQLAGELRLGPVVWTNPPVTDGSARLGVAALDRWRVVFDPSAGRVYFLDGNPERRWEPTAPPPLRLRSGLFTRVEGESLRVLEVDKGTAADLAGVRRGDLILTINGQPARAIDYAGTAGAQSPSRLALRVQRGNREFAVTLLVGPSEPEKN